MLNIVFLDRASLPVAMPALEIAHTWQEFAQTVDDDEILARCMHAEVIVSNKVRLNQSVLAKLHNTRLIVSAATGVNHIDIEACQALGIALCNVRNYGDDSVAEHALMLMLSLWRNLPAYSRDVSAGAWSNSAQFCHFGAPIRTLKGSTLGLVGYGGIAKCLEQKAQMLGMKVLRAERARAQNIREGYHAFDEVLAQADILSLHCPLNEDTHHLMNEQTLQKMKFGAILINTARGALIEDRSLIAALKYGQLAGAGIDVLDTEPPAFDHPLIKTRLPNLIVTPHIAWASTQAMQNLATQIKQGIEAFDRNLAFNRVV